MNRATGWMSVGLGAIGVGFGLAWPSGAHQVKVGADVAALFHLEPDHNPRSGEPATIWFSLTRKGGATIPLDRCNCQLTISPRLQSPTAPQPWQPPLTPKAAEGFQNMPGATTVFPAAGAYDLVLKGQPKQPGDFQPFEFRYETTVLAGAAPAASSTPSPVSAAIASPVAAAETTTETPWHSGELVWSGVGGVGLGFLGLWAVTRSRR